MQSGDVVDDRFELERLAGAGAMGEVWRARDRATGSAVAVKLLERVEEGWDTRFVRESMSLAQLDHPNIVKYVAHGHLESGGFYLAMEWLEGEDLAETLTRGPLGTDETIGLVRRVAEALALAHSQGIVHRDIKPGNLFLVQGSLRDVKVVDFGVAKIKDFTGTWTRNGWMLGTPAYMAPEQVRGERDIDARADLFALGCVAFECVTGRIAFGGGQVLAALRSILHDATPHMSDTVSNVPAEFDALVWRMMSKDVGERPRDASEVLRALSGFEIHSERMIDVRRRKRALTTREQRIVSVLIIAGTKLAKSADARTTIVSSECDPDDLDPSGQFAVLLQKTGAKLDRFAGDSLVVTFPASGVPIDRAAQAARCALSLGRILPGRAMAIATGPRDPGEETESAALDRGARLLIDRVGKASASIALDETTAHLVDARFEVVQAADGSINLRAERDLPTPASARPPAETGTRRANTCVGRDRELAAVRANLAQCIEESVARVVLVTGTAGTGKSSVCREFLDRLATADLEVLIARADPLAAGAPYGIVSQWIGALSAPTEEAASAAWNDFVRTHCARAPLLLVVEDLQWGDQPSVKLLDGALRDHRDAPLMVLAFARPEVHDLFPKLWAEREVEEVRLGTLTRSASERLVQQALGDAATADDVAKIVERGEGNPFYLEELSRAASERRDEVPETLLAMVHSTLEKIDAESRRALRAASVFGTTFWKGGVAHLLGGAANADDHIARLVDAGLIAKREASRFKSDEEYAFCDPLVREGAYHLLTDADRALGHELAGEWLEKVGEPDESVISGHRERGGSRQSA